MHKRRFLRTCATVGLAVVLVGACSDQRPAFAAIDITGAEYARDFVLPDQDGRTRSIKDFAGKVVVVFFGYTQCPDVCPTTMAELAEVRRQLGPDGAKVQGVFITIDPERDSPQVLKAYVGNFDPTFVALRPAPGAQLEALVKDFRAYAKKVEGRTPTSYTMDHSAGNYIYDGNGRIRLFTRYGTGPAPLLADIRQLLQGR